MVKLAFKELKAAQADSVHCNLLGFPLRSDVSGAAMVLKLWINLL